MLTSAAVSRTSRTAPRRRLLQHLGTARLWLPDELPWWVPSPRLRPLYQWMRELYRDGGRLPVMVVSAWVGKAEARLAERVHIEQCLERALPLLNVERELAMRRQTAEPRGRQRRGRHEHPGSATRA